ncbi:MAG: Rid family detoxifying hydrolase [Lysobacterales bacterium]
MSKQTFHTKEAPAAIGTYSQAVRHGDLVFLSGQIPLVPASMELVGDDFEAQVRQVFDNLGAVCAAAGAGLDDIVKLTVYLVDMDRFAEVNHIMGEYFSEPYPARAAIGVASLPRGAQIEMDAIVGV